MTYEQIERLREIQEEIKELANEALKLLPKYKQQAASSYWHAHILSALNSSSYCGGPMVDLESQITQIEEDFEDEQD